MAQTRRSYLNEIPADQKLPLRTVLSPAFVDATTDFDSTAAFFDASPWAWRTPAQFRALTDDDRFDQYVDDHSEFSSWRAMEDTATLWWYDRRETPDTPYPARQPMENEAILQRIDRWLANRPE